MRTFDEHTHVSDYWDEFVKEFGISAYVEERYEHAGVSVRNVYDTVESWLLAVSNLTEVSGGKRVSTEQRT